MERGCAAQLNSSFERKAGQFLKAAASVLLFASAALANAQPSVSVSGRVLDPAGAGVPDAHVQITARDLHIERTARTSATGDYRFPALPPGLYLLTARAPAFSSPPAVELALESGTAESRDIPLELARVSTQVQVTAAASAQTTEEQGKAIDVVDSIELAERAEYSAAEAIRNLPGIRIRQLGGPGSLTRISTRGLRAFDTAVLIDGFRFRDPASPQGEATAFIGDLLLVNSDRIEVLRGSGSSLYGTHADGGVVNIVTDAGGGRTHGDISIDGGGLGLFRGVARMGGGLLAERVRYSAGVAHLNVTSGVDNDDRYRNSTAQASAQATLTPVLALTGRVFASGNFSQLNVIPYAPADAAVPASGVIPASAGVNFAPSPNDPDSRRDARFVSTLVALSHRPTPSASWRVQYQGLGTDRDNRNGPLGPSFQPASPNANYFGGRVDTLQGRADLQLRRANLITVGYEWERETFDNHARAAATDARLLIDQASNTFWIHDQIRLAGDRLHISLSGRTQSFDADEPRFQGGAGAYEGVVAADLPRAWTGDVSIAYLLAKSGTKLRAHIGNGYRAASLYERFGSYFFGGSFSGLGDPFLAPERLVSFDAGFDRYLAQSRLRISGTWFYTRLQEVIAYDPAIRSLSRFGGYTNTGGGLSRGLEFSLEARPVSAVTLRSAYTYTNTDERRPVYPDAGLRTIAVSEHMFTTTGTCRMGRRFDVTGDFFAASDYLFPLSVGFNTRIYSFAAPVKLDLSAGYTHPLTDTSSVRFFARLENALNREYYEEGFRTPRAWAIGGMKWSF
jgi:iron complex outermembrane receptor protein